MSKGQSIKLLETVFSSAAAKIDREQKVIRGVKVLGRDSANGRSYSDEAMEDAARLYEGMTVCVDHDRKEPNRERGFAEGIGILRTVSRKADGVYADLHYFEAHDVTPLLLECAERFPDKLGLSHNADGRGSRKGGKVIVESISKINSVDLVRNPATNKGLFESKEITVSKTVKEILESVFPKTFGDGKLLEEVPGYAAMSVESPAEASSDQQTKAAFRAMVMSAFDDESLDTKATTKRIGDILKAYDKLTGSSSSRGDKPESKETTMESKEKPAADPRLDKLLESVERIEKREADREKREKAKAVLDEFKVTHDTALIESMVKLPDEASMKALAERESKLRPQVSRGQKPLIESRAAQEKPLDYPKDSKSFASALR